MKQRERDCHNKAFYPTPARKRNFKRGARYALFGAATAFIAVPGMASADDFFKLDNKGVFFKLDNPADTKFNQLLGINDHDIIAGYFGADLPGDLTPFNGYVLVPNTHYSVENFAGTPPLGSRPRPSALTTA